MRFLLEPAALFRNNFGYIILRVLIPTRIGLLKLVKKLLQESFFRFMHKIQNCFFNKFFYREPKRIIIFFDEMKTPCDA